MVAVTALSGIVVASIPEPDRRQADAATSCPNGTGYGGAVTADANSGLSSAGHGCVIIVHSAATEVLTFTGNDQTWTVPTGVTSVELHVIGAGGGGGLQGRNGSAGSNGGGGGYATGSLPVVPGDVYTVIVGQGGRHQCVADLTTADLTSRRNFNYGGGAAGFGGASWDCSWSSGGGRSALRAASGIDDIIAAGGGGGGGYEQSGGAGGGTSGSEGVSTWYAAGGGGGTQSAGGAGGTGEPGYEGIQYAGGPAGVNVNGPSEGGGGGGGYFGGGGGGNNSGGGGGSSYVGAARGLISGSTTAGNGRVPGAIAPVNTGAPTISGTAQVGETLTATTGAWSGATARSFTWQQSPDNGATWTNIDGATNATYVVGVSGLIRVVETARNYFGTTTANSLATTAIVDTTLSDMTVSEGTLDPVFSSGVFSYAVVVPYATTSLRVTPTRTHSTTTLTVNGSALSSGVASPSIDLDVGANTITVVATNTGVSTTTTITVTREAATVPGAPAITTVTPGQGRLTVEFSAPTSDGGETITDYEYSQNNGTWVSAATTSSPLVITGLADATTYSVRVRARNVVGVGAASVAVSGTTSTPTTTTTAATTTTVATTTTSVSSESTTTISPSSTSPDVPTPAAPPSPEAPIVQATTPTFPRTRDTGSIVTDTTTIATVVSQVTPTSTSTTTTSIPNAPDTGEDGVAMVVGDQEIPATVERISGVVTASSGSLRVEIAGVTANGTVAPFDIDGNIRLGNKGRLRVGTEGFAAGSVAVVWLYSDPVRLGGLAVATDGKAKGDLLIPSNVEDGLHRAVVRGFTDRGAPVQVAVDVVVGEPGRVSRDYRMIFLIALTFAGLAGMFLPAVIRRRRDDEEHL